MSAEKKPSVVIHGLKVEIEHGGWVTEESKILVDYMVEGYDTPWTLKVNEYSPAAGWVLGFNLRNGDYHFANISEIVSARIDDRFKKAGA